MITVCCFILLHYRTFVSFFAESWIVRTSSTASLKSVATKKNYQVIYIVNQFTMYAALFFFMHIYVGYYFWGGIIITSEGVFPIELVRDQFFYWIGVYYFSRQLIQRTA